jgi:hypothetical protein
MAFFDCTNLKSINTPGSVKSFGYMEFDGCSKNLIINCTAGSYAESYAKNNSINYSTRIASISVSEKPTKLNYKKGQALNLSGGKLKVVYADSSTKTIAMASASASGYNSGKKGKQTITLKYKGVSCKLTITVN